MNYFSIKKALFPAVILLFAVATPMRADLFYSSAEYDKLYNEKVALELELKAVKNQYKNELSDCDSKRKDLESRIESLNKEIEILKKRNEDDRALNDKRIKELEKRTDILKKKGGDREKELIDENRKLQQRYEDELKKLRAQLKDALEGNIKQIADLKEGYEKKIAELKKEISNLNDELSELKKLNKQQKEELQRMEAQANELEKQLQDEIKKGEIRLKRFHDKLVINIDDRISFDSGSSELKKEILPALDKITKILSDYPEYQIVVEGHTDNVPIHTAKFRNNWQLSTERSLSVLGYILKNRKIAPSRFSAAGYGEYNPIVSNNTPENRSLNRRVDIVVIPRVKK